MEDPERGGWQNSTLAIQIARVTESFGRELAHIWSNESSSVTTLESNIGKLPSDIRESDYMKGKAIIRSLYSLKLLPIF